MAKPRATRAGAATFRPATGPLLAVAAATRAASVALPLPAPWKRTRTPDRDRAPKPAVGLGRRVGSLVIALPDHPWLDRVVRGRVWIPLLGVLLAGIVAAQVEILKLGASMGRALEQTTTLTTQNEQLRGNVAQLADDQRIERLADGMGLVFPPPGAVGYIDAKPGGDAGGARHNIHAPDAASFMALAAKNGALVTGSGTSTLPPPAGAPLPPTTATTPTTTPTGSASAPSGATATATSASAGTTAATGTSTTSPSSAPTQSAATTQSGPTTSQSAGNTSQAPATTTPSAGTTEPPAPTTSPTQSSTAPPTGAAAIQPSGTSQQTGGG